MKLATATNEYHSGGNVKEINYRVASSPHMMEILSSKIYSNKIAAVIRELSTNAFESHMKAGTSQKYHVNLPTPKNLTFTIRDFGTGLSLDQIQTMYTTYGVSDKGDSNEFTGCLGLGSKSPFAYTDTFTTISYHDGKKICVVNTKDKSGIPNCVVMEIMDTTEPNGLEIYFDVNYRDVYEFTEEAERIYRFFDEDKQPSCNVKINIQHPPYKYSGKNWRLVDSGTSYAVMGQIAYEIDKYKINNRKVIQLLNCGIIVDFNIGEISMAASREHLEYNDHTINALESKLNLIYNEVIGTITKSVNDCKSNFEAAITAKNILRNYQFINKADIKWNGKDIVYDLNITRLMNDNKVDFVIRKFHPYGRNSKSCCSYLNIEDDIEIYYADKIGAISASEQRARSANKTVYLIQSDDSSYINLIKDAIGINEIKPASSLPKITTSRGAACYFCEFIQKYRSRSSDYWSNIEIDPDVDSGIYVNINNSKIDGSVDPYDLYRLLEYLQGLGIKIPQIIGVKKGRASKVATNKDWIKLETWLDEQLAKVINDKYSFYIANKDKIGLYNSSLWQDLKKSINAIDKKSILHTIADMEPTVKELESFKKIEGINSLYLKLYNKDIKIKASTTVIPDHTKRYPLLPHLRYVDSKLIVDYINLVERV